MTDHSFTCGSEGRSAGCSAAAALKIRINSSYPRRHRLVRQAKLISYPVEGAVAGLADGTALCSEDGALGWLGDDSDRMGTDTCRSIGLAF